MRKKHTGWIIAAVCLLFVLYPLVSFLNDAHMTGVGTVSSYIERFNEGGPPQGMTLDDGYDEALIIEKKPYVQREVRVRVMTPSRYIFT